MFNHSGKQWRIPGGKVYSLLETMAAETHLLIAGSTGSGKSCLENGIITTLLQTKSPNDCKFILIDPKLTELYQYKDLPHVIMYASRPHEIRQALISTNELMESRLQQMQKRGEKKSSQASVYIFIDELAQIMLVQKKECKPLLQSILQLARAASIHVIACTQVTLATVVPTELKINFTGVVGLKVPMKKDSTLITGFHGAECFPDPSTDKKAYCIYRHGATATVYQLPYIEQQKTDQLITYWKDRKQCIK